MKKVFKMQDLECAHCAAKMEDAINKLEGVNKASISFMTQKLTLDADEARFDDIVKEAVKICKSIEPDCEILL
ncbi:MAG: cation transporter [Firmicutes bacterium]|nr:cation transporter [Bacillota bacterium]